MAGQDKKKEIEQALKEIGHPEITHTLYELGMIDNIEVEDNKVSLVLKLPFLSVPIKDYLINAIKQKVSEKDSAVEVRIEEQEMSPQERAKFMALAQSGWRG